MSTSTSLPDPPRDLDAILQVEQSLILPTFTSETAWKIGSSLRSRLVQFPSAAVINIALANSNQLLFHTSTKSGVVPDNDLWVSRKRATVLRWGNSTWAMHNKFQGDETQFSAKYMLGGTAGNYAIHGGGFPIRVKGVEGVVAVIVVSGLKQEQDHQIIVEVLQEHLQSLSGAHKEIKRMI